MGQQQFFLLILGAILIAVAVAVAFGPNHENTANLNRDAVAKDLMDLAARAQQYYHAAANIGGGDGSFTNITMSRLTNKTTNDNGTLSIGSTEPQQLLLVGKGVSLAGTDSVEVQCTVTANGYILNKIH